MELSSFIFLIILTGPCVFMLVCACVNTFLSSVKTDAESTGLEKKSTAIPGAGFAC